MAVKKFKRNRRKILNIENYKNVICYLTILIDEHSLIISHVRIIINKLFKTHQLLNTGLKLTVEKARMVLILGNKKINMNI